MKIEITGDDISYAEKILLRKERKFDKEERVKFIKNLDTIDLQAVPGSGKTTALLAKLLILDRHLPFDNGSGILVLSHTNAAVDEIKDKIGKHCSRLFSYPHFVGTIQQFVNRFLAIPYFAWALDIRIDTVDAEIHSDKVIKKFRKVYWHKDFGEPGKWLWRKHNKRAGEEASKKNTELKDECDKLINNNVAGLYYDLKDEIIKDADGKTFLKNKKNEKFKCFEAILLQALVEGIMSYDYAYHVADVYIDEKKKMRDYLQKRFSCVFVDEMQDMAPHQYDILEKLFHSSDRDSSCFQRIGDNNQAIYSREIYTDEVWKDRNAVLKLNGSYRLSKPIAKAIKCFGETSQKIDARGDSNALPVVIVYDDNSKDQVIQKFVDKIKELKLHELNDPRFYAIGWVKNKEKRLSIGDFWDEFEPNQNINKKEQYDTLADYLNAAKNNRSKQNYKILNQFIVNALLEILKIEGIKCKDAERYYSKTTLFNFLKKDYADEYIKLRQNLYKWGTLFFQDKDISDEIKNYINKFIFSVFGKRVSQSKNFLNRDSQLGNKDMIDEKLNIHTVEDVSIKFGTVHSVKGQTHTATLYLETFNGGGGAGKKGYDSEKLKAQFEGTDFNGGTEYQIQNTRIAYVGMSRPTHLLCVAIHKDRLPNIDCESWDVVDIASSTININGKT